MTYEAKISNIIMRLKEVRGKQPDLTMQKISDHTGVSMSTVSRIFAEGSEKQSFRYDSIRPIAQMLRGIDDLDEGDEDEKALKAIIQFKDSTIKELREKHEEEKTKYEKKLEKERAQHRASIEFLKHQVELKDDRINRLMTGIEHRTEMYDDLNGKYHALVDRFMNKE